MATGDTINNHRDTKTFLDDFFLFLLSVHVTTAHSAHGCDSAASSRVCSVKIRSRWERGRRKVPGTSAPCVAFKNTTCFVLFLCALQVKISMWFYTLIIKISNGELISESASLTYNNDVSGAVFGSELKKVPEESERPLSTRGRCNEGNLHLTLTHLKHEILQVTAKEMNEWSNEWMQ